jgi:hypothetical protein
MPQFGPGDGPETVLLGCLVKEHLRLWRADGRAECVRVSQPAALRALLGRGVAPRTTIAPERFREIGQLESGGVLRIGKRKFAVEICEEPTVTEALWAAAIEVLQHAAADAISRGEFVVVEPGWNSISEAYAIAGARKTPGEWLLHVEAIPAPRAPSWPEPPEGQPGWGVAAVADADALAALGSLLGDAVSMWALSPLDVVLTYGTHPDGPWPPEQTPDSIDRLLGEMRADIAELHSLRQIPRAKDLSERSGFHFNDNTYPVFFTGDLRSRLVLVHPNPQQAENTADHYEGEFQYANFDDYLEQHRRYGHYHWELGTENPTPFDHKQIRFLRHWGVIDVVESESRDEQRINLARAFDQRLQLELIPYGSPTFPTEGFPRDVIAPHYQRLLRVITSYPRDYVVLGGAVFDKLLEPYIVNREDHRFRLPTSSGTSRIEYRFSNLLLEFDGKAVPVGLAPHFTNPGVPMDAYGQTCHELYRALRP